MQRIGAIQVNEVAAPDVPFLARFLGKLVLDVLPAALASVIGGFLFTQYQFGHTATQQPAAEQAAPASAEMMQLVRDEHALIVNFLKSQAAAEKTKFAAEDRQDAQAAADAKMAAAAAIRRLTAASLESKPAAARSKAPVVAAIVVPHHPPLVVARADLNDAAAPVAPAGAVASPARDPDSLVAKTLVIKDHVVDATLHAVSAIGGIPSWIASMGGRLSGGANSGPTERQFSAAS